MNTTQLKMFLHISQCPKPLNPLRTTCESKTFSFFLLVSSRNQSPSLCSCGTEDILVFLNTSSKVSLTWYQYHYYIIMIPTIILFSPSGFFNKPVGVLKLPDLAPSLYISSSPLEGGSAVKLWLKKAGWNSQVQQQGCYPKLSTGWCKALPSLRIPGSYLILKGCVVQQYQPAVEHGALVSSPDDICLSLSQDQPCTEWSLLKWNCIKTQFTTNSWLLKPKAGSARHRFC